MLARGGLNGLYVLSFQSARKCFIQLAQVIGSVVGLLGLIAIGVGVGVG